MPILYQGLTGRRAGKGERCPVSLSPQPSPREPRARGAHHRAGRTWTRRRRAGVAAAVALTLAVAAWGVTSAFAGHPDGASAQPVAGSSGGVTDLPGDGSRSTSSSAATATPTSSPTPNSPPTSRSAPAPPGGGTTTPTKAPANGGDERKIRAYVTGYSYFDNTPPGSATISNPVVHRTAGGTGTFDDPITVAVGHSISGGSDTLDWPAGTKFYVPNLRRYLIAEDTCGDGSRPQDGPCHVGFPASATTWLDVWVGGKGGSRNGADDCMGNITDVWDVLVKPRPDHVVVSGDIYSGAGCTQQFGNALAG
jgi:hypothetical protein